MAIIVRFHELYKYHHGRSRLFETCSHKTRTKSPEILDGFLVFPLVFEGFLSPSPIPSVWYSWVSPIR